MQQEVGVPMSRQPYSVWVLSSSARYSALWWRSGGGQGPAEAHDDLLLRADVEPGSSRCNRSSSSNSSNSSTGEVPVVSNS